MDPSNDFVNFKFLPRYFDLFFLAKQKVQSIPQSAFEKPFHF
jgi:hypothetical protein